MLDANTSHQYNIILSIILGISLPLFIHYLLNKNNVIEISYPKIK
jgi:hypothetical protein